MPLTVEQFTQRLTSSGVMSEDDLRSWIASVPVEQRPLDGELLARELVKQKRLTKFQAEQIYAGKEKSLTLGNYLLLDKLGQGGMGMVLKATHKRMGRVVALKVMSPAAVKSADAVKRFHREVQTAAKLTHPNIVTAFDADEAKGTHFLVMEYVEGDDLSQLVKKHGPMSVEQAIECIIQAARGLTHAHAEGVIHRDIKPANLLLDKNGIVKILDMGLARLESGLSDEAGVEGAGLTQSGTIMGTVDYMSPEQAEDTRHADARADIYALGCSLYYLLTGHAVYGGETMMKKLLAHRDAAIPSLVAALRSRTRQSSEGRDESGGYDEHGSLTTSATSALDAIFHKMIAKRLADRYQSMAEVIADLERCRAGQSVTMNVAAASESGSSNELQKFLRQISGEEESHVTSASPLGTRVASGAEMPETMLLSSNGAGTDPQTEMTLAGGQHDAPASGFSAITTRWRVVLASVGVVLLLLGAWWMFRTPRGTVQIEIADEQIAVTFGETGRKLRGKTEESLWLPIGEHVLHVQIGETTLDTPEITVAKNEPVELKFERVGNRVRVMRNKEFLVAKELPRSKPGGGKADGTAMASVDFALRFEDPKSLVKLSDLPLDRAKPFTLEAFVTSRKRGPAEQSSVAQVILTSALAQLGIASQSNQLLFHMYHSKGATQVVSSTSLEADKRTHVALIRQANQMQFFVDGKLSGTKELVDLSVQAETAWQIGGGNRDFFEGEIDEVRISKVARYAKDFTPKVRFEPDADTLALYHFDEGQGKVLKDSSGNGHHGQIVAAKWVKADGTAMASVDFALRFEDPKSLVKLPVLPLDSSKPFTLEAFVTSRRRVPTEHYSQVQNLVVSQGQVHFGIRSQTSQLCFSVYHSKGYTGLDGSTSLVKDKRTHVACMRQGNQVQFFVDGKLSGTKELVDLSVQTATKPWHIGGGGFDFFDGEIDEVRISKVARYAKDFTPQVRFEPDADTLALYHFDEGQGEVLKDSSGNGHHGQIVAAKWVKADGSPITPADPERRAAESLLSLSDRLVISGPTADGKSFHTSTIKNLPTESFRIESLTTNSGAKFGDVDIELLEPLASLKNLGLGGTVEEITDEGLRRLKKLRGLRDLTIASTKISNQGLTHLKELPNLIILKLHFASITDDGMKTLSEIPNLKHLYLTDVPITNVGLPHIRQASNLRHLNLHSSKVTDQGLVHLRGSKLEGLSLIQTPGITDAGLVHLQDLKLNGLNLTDDKGVGDAGLEHLQEMKALGHLWLNGTSVSAAGVQKLAAALPKCIIHSDHGTFGPPDSTAADRRAAEWVLSIGGSIKITENGQERPIKVVSGLPPGAFELTLVDLTYNKEMSDAGLAHFQDCKNLKVLGLHHSPQISDAGVAHFKDCKNLTVLNLNGSQVSDAGLANFQGCNLTSLDLNQTKVGDAGLDHFQDWKNLTYLSLGSTKVSDAGLARFQVSKNLLQLHLSNTGVSDAGLAHFKDCKNLTNVDLGQTKLSNAGLAHFKDYKNLISLNLDNTQVTDAGVGDLAGCSKLVTLKVTKTKVTEAGVMKLSAALLKCRIEWDGGVIEPKVTAPAEATKITPHEKFPVLKGHEGPIRRIRFLPDGKQFVSVARDGTARLWNVETGEMVRQFASSESDKTLNNLAVSPDGKRLAMGGSSFRVYLFDIASGKLERFIQLKDLEQAAIGGLSFSADGSSLFVGNVPGVLHEFRVADGSSLSAHKLFDQRVMSIVPLPDNERLLVGAWSEQSFVLWNRTKQQVEQRFAWTEQFQSARSMNLLADGDRVASTHDNSLVRIWSLKTGAELKRWPAHPGKALAATDVIPLHNDRWLLTLGDDKAIRLWDGKTFEKLDEATTEMLGTGQGAVSPDGRTLVTGAGWRLTTQSEYDGHHDLHVWRLPVP